MLSSFSDNKTSFVLLPKLMTFVSMILEKMFNYFSNFFFTRWKNGYCRTPNKGSQSQEKLIKQTNVRLVVRLSLDTLPRVIVHPSREKHRVSFSAYSNVQVQCSINKQWLKNNLLLECFYIKMLCLFHVYIKSSTRDHGALPSARPYNAHHIVGCRLSTPLFKTKRGPWTDGWVSVDVSLSLPAELFVWF